MNPAGTESQAAAENFNESIAAIREARDNGNSGALLKLIEELHPADLAQILTVLPRKESTALFPVLRESGKIAETVVELPEGFVEETVEQIDAQELAPMVESLDPDDAVDLLQFLDNDKKQEVLSLLPRGKIREVNRLLSYGENTAGALMDPRFTAVADTLSVGQAIDELRAKRDELDAVYNLFVVDRRRRLVGVIKINELILLEPSARLSSCIQAKPVTIHTDTPNHEVASIFAKYDLTSAPVVTPEQKLVGRITIDDIVDLIQEENTKDVYALNDLNESDRVFTSPVNSAKLRVPWLIIHFFTALIATYVISSFESTLRSAVVLAGLMPIVAGIGGNAGAQSLTVIIRGLALGELQSTNSFRAISKEVIVGLFTGLSIGLVGMLTVGIWKGSWVLGAVLGMALFLNLLLASCLAALIPITLKKVNIDPALASTTLLTALTDAGGFLLFLSLSKFFIEHIPID